MKKSILFLLLCTLPGHLLAQQVLIPYRDKRKWGYADLQGKIIIKPAYELTTFFDGEYAVVKGVKGEGVVNKKGKLMVPPVYDIVRLVFYKNDRPLILSNRVAEVYLRKGSVYGLYDLVSGKLLLDTVYRFFNTWGEWLKVSTYTDRYGLFDLRTRQWLLQPVYQSIDILKDSLFLLKREGEEYTVAISPKGVEKPRLFIRPDKSNGISSLKGIMFMSALPGEEYIPEEDKDKYKYGIFYSNRKYGYRFAGKFRGDSIPPMYEYIEYSWVHKGKLVVQMDGKTGIIDSKNNILIPFARRPIFSYCSNEDAELYATEINGKRAVIDKNEKVLAAGYDAIDKGDHYLKLTKNNKHSILFAIPGKKPLLIDSLYDYVDYTAQRIFLGDGEELFFIKVGTGPQYHQFGYLSSTGKVYFKD